METFSLLKYWRTGGATVFGSGGAGAGNFSGNKRPPVDTTTIVASVTNNVVDATSQEDDTDDGPFFDLKLTVPEEGEEEEVRKVKAEGVNFNGGGCDEEEENADPVSGGEDDDASESAEEGEYNESVDSCTEEVVSPSDLFFEENLVSSEHSELELEGSEANSRRQFHASLLKSATKFRIFMLGLAKSKNAEKPSTEIDGSAIAVATRKKENVVEDEEKSSSINNKQRKLLMVKFKVDEVPFISLFTRDTSSRNIDKNNNKDEAEQPDEKKFSKDVMHKYINKVKPLYVRVSRRYGEKLRFSGQLSNGTTGVKRLPPQAEGAEVKSTEVMVSQKQGNLSAAGMRVVRKHLGKSRSSSSLVAADPSPAKPKRRDDSLLEQHDGIQGAILHCKRSFNASRDSES